MDRALHTGYLVREMKDDDLEIVLSWRNQDEVRRYMYTRHRIGMEEHRRWFERTSRDNDSKLLILEYQATPIGFINFRKSSHNTEEAEWGFYLAPNAPRGAGGALGEKALEYAFTTLKLNKVLGEVLAYNERSIRFHLRMGFQKEKIFSQKYFDGCHYHDVIIFTISEHDWMSSHYENHEHTK